ncbi:MAG: chemotaxis response regulator protein-glutamate methylesterase [Gammaproteobacteria bacterium]|nr:chemotaxis response regulator protein-glutamate methylesterase [Gammaproteobacteria bacterium]MBU2478647.1 chemotaxis response regulator protein-glutamate methylesterase [Gammaproteobacteria bacterium]
MRVAVVNDSKLAAESLRRVIADSGRHQVAWVAEDGADAVHRCADDVPDLILMDLIMPVMDGVAATRQIMAKTPCAIVVVTASVSGNAGKVFEAMGAGALDAINTPILGMNGTSGGHEALLHKIDMVGRLIEAPKRISAPHAPVHHNPCAVPGRCPPLIAIGASTGGPAALKTILEPLPSNLAAAIIIVQHVDEEFARSFAEWLNEQTALKVRLAQPGDRPQPGQVLIAGREDHLILTRESTLDYTAKPEDYPYRPSVNVFFETVARHWGGQAVGVLLTGMGKDGGNGLLALRQAGCHTIAQDQASSAIYGMPKAAAEIGAAVDILELKAIGPALLKSLRRPITA